MGKAPVDMARTTSVTDTRLMRRSQQGDRRAFRALLTRYDWRLRGLAHALLLDPDQVDAVLRLAYVKAWREVVRIDPRDDASAWLYRVVYNACIDGLRRESSRIGAAPLAALDVPDAAADAPPEPAQPVATGNGASPAPTDGRRRRLVEALAALAPADRVAVVLVDRERFAPEAAARILGLTPEVVETRLAGARARLTRQLAAASPADDAAAPLADDAAAPLADTAASPADDGAAPLADDGAASSADDAAAPLADDAAAPLADTAASPADDAAAPLADDGASWPVDAVASLADVGASGSVDAAAAPPADDAAAPSDAAASLPADAGASLPADATAAPSADAAASLPADAGASLPADATAAPSADAAASLPADAAASLPADATAAPSADAAAVPSADATAVPSADDGAASPADDTASLPAEALESQLEDSEIWLDDTAAAGPVDAKVASPSAGVRSSNWASGDGDTNGSGDTRGSEQ
jgi:RNA polymerase sigma-70 factor (ECF subfamily)